MTGAAFVADGGLYADSGMPSLTGQLASHVPPTGATLDHGEPRMIGGWIAKSELARR